MICHHCCRGYIADGCDVRPCPECGGSGIVHCCEGERPDQCPERSRGATSEPTSPNGGEGDVTAAVNIAKLPGLLRKE
jgi:hypothetical protein